MTPILQSPRAILTRDMKKYPTITVFVVIAVHVALCWWLCDTIGTGRNSRPLQFSIVVGELTLPAMLLGLARRLPLVLRTLIVVLTLQVASYQLEQRLFFILLAFIIQVFSFALIWSVSTGWYFSSVDESTSENRQGNRFSIMQLLGSITAIAFVLAVIRTRFDVFHVLKQGRKEEWIMIALLAVSLLLTTSAVLARRHALIISLFAIPLVLATVLTVPLRLGNERWMFATMVLVGMITSALPAIALRLCGWQWVRRRSEASPFDSPERGEIS